MSGEREENSSNTEGGSRTLNMVMPVAAAERFLRPERPIVAIEPYGAGIIHDTYLVTAGSENYKFILQRINDKVFRDPTVIMHNLRVVCDHVQNRCQAGGLKKLADWRMTRIVTTRDGRDFFVDAEDGFWRALSFIHGARTLAEIVTISDAREVGRALGIFHLLTSDLSPKTLRVTLPGFHNIEDYLEQYDAVSTTWRRSGEADRFCRQFIAARRGWAPVLEKACRQEILPQRIIHGDPKINNIMVDNATGKAVSIIDLDTVMPGPVHYDIGDCLRSCCNTMGEDAAEPSAIRFDLSRCRAVLSGYIEAAHHFLTESDFNFLPDAIRLLPFELGIRFYTDFLAGNTYFKVKYPDQNLRRAMVQFRLVQSIEEQTEEIGKIIEESRSA